MITVAVTGANGVVGQIITENLPDGINIIDLYRSKKYAGKRKIHKHFKLNLLDASKIPEILSKIKFDFIIHMAASTHIDKCERDKKNGKNGEVWKINVESTNEISKFCKKNNIHLIFLSTECVFDGKKDFFDEKSKKNPINWYGITKSEGEDKILETSAKSTIIRSVVAYHKNDNGKTIYGKILRGLKSGGIVSVVSDQKFTPTSTYDISKSVNIVINKKLTGVFHIAPEKNITPYELAKIIAKKNKISLSLVKGEKLIKYYGEERARLRLKNSSLSGKKTNKKLGFIPLSPDSAL